MASGTWTFTRARGPCSAPTANGKSHSCSAFSTIGSRLCCHLQWYLEETAEALIHALSQAFQRGLPRALLTDNGAAMTAAETVEGLERLGILHHTTLPYSPSKTENKNSSGDRLKGGFCPCSRASPTSSAPSPQYRLPSWVEEEYQRKEHSELCESPLGRLPARPLDARLRRASLCVPDAATKQRRHVTVEGARFEVPSAYRTLLRLRVARWDSSSVDLVDLLGRPSGNAAAAR